MVRLEFVWNIGGWIVTAIKGSLEGVSTFTLTRVELRQHFYYRKLDFTMGKMFIALA